ncbi:MAG: superoxide dismutase [Deltaproteobacteria bacterium]|nr:superoxide dismutase [Deltaproteobacteria bacterium]
MAVEPLPYAENALEPYMSAETLQYHYNHHYAAYVKAANRLTQERRFRGKTPEEVLVETGKKRADAAVFNQVGQAWNHAFYWQCLKPKGGGEPGGRLAERIARDFGSYKKFKKAFTEAAGAVFGSGWVWLALDGDRLKIMGTSNADSPLVHGMQPLWVVDVWEHAYYLDYRNRRGDFVLAVLEHLANWDFAERQLAQHLPE